MKTENLLDLHKETAEKCLNIMEKKNHDYTGGEDHDALKNFKQCERMGICSAEKGILVRMIDKIMRLSTYAEKDDLKVGDEGAMDTIHDIINYSILLKGMIKDSDEKSTHTVKENVEIPVANVGPELSELVKDSNGVNFHMDDDKQEASSSPVTNN